MLNQTTLFSSKRPQFKVFKTPADLLSVKTLKRHETKWISWLQGKGDSINVIDVVHRNFFGDMHSEKTGNKYYFLLCTTIIYTQIGDPVSGRL